MTTQWMNLKGPEGKGLQLRKAVWAELQEIGARLLTSCVISSRPWVHPRDRQFA